MARPRRDQGGKRGVVHQFLGARGPGIGAVADDQIGGGHDQQFQRDLPGGAGRNLGCDVAKARARQHLVRQRAFAKAIAIGEIDHRARPILGGGQGGQICLELADQGLCLCLAAQKRAEFGQPVGDIGQLPHPFDLFHPDAKPAQHRERGRVGPRIGQHQIGAHEVDFLGAAVVQRIARGEIGEWRGDRIGRDIADRDQLTGCRQHQRELVGAQVHRHDAQGRALWRDPLRWRLRAQRPRHKGEANGKGAQGAHQKRDLRPT